MKKRLPILSLLLACLVAPAHARYAGPDLSGTYDCTGEDGHEGSYTGKVILQLVKAHSDGKHGAYSFKLEVEGYGSYPGHGVARGKEMAIFFANADPSTQDFGTGFATFSKNKAGKWTFTKYYYEPEYKGGNSGTEACVQE